MVHSARLDHRFTASAFDSTVTEPTSKLLVESMSRIRAAAPTSVASPIAHLLPPPAPDQSGPFKLVCEIAAGGMATVHLGINRGLAGFEKFAAVKRIHRHLAQDKEFYEMFIDEARIAAQVNHPYVCSVFDFGCADQSYYIAMEFLNGEPLSRVLACAGPKCLGEARFPKLVARIIANLAEGLHAAHSLCDASGRCLDIIHRDVTPQNLFVLYDGTVRVTDFGIARARNRLHHTHGQRVRGTLGYMAPEQLQREALDQGVDIWSLGVVMWEMLTARTLFESSNYGEAVTSVLTQTILPPSTYNPRVSTSLDRIVMRALERERSDRYHTARDLSRALEQYLTSSGTSVHATDVAEWLAGLFPTGNERGRELLDMARASVQELPRSESGPEEPAPVTRREPLAGRRIASTPPRDSMSSLPALALDGPRSYSSRPAPHIEAHVPTFSASPTRRIADHLVGLALLGTAALIGFRMPQSMIRQSPAAASRSGAEVASLNALTPSAVAPTEGQAPPRPWAPPLRLEASETSRPEPPPSRPLPTKQVLARPHSRAALPKNLPSLPEVRPVGDSAPRARLGGVFISSPAISASVSEAGRLLGSTSQQIDLAAGTHTLTVKSGTESREIVIDVAAGAVKLSNVTFALR